MKFTLSCASVRDIKDRNTLECIRNAFTISIARQSVQSFRSYLKETYSWAKRDYKLVTFSNWLPYTGWWDCVLHKSLNYNIIFLFMVHNHLTHFLHHEWREANPSVCWMYISNQIYWAKINYGEEYISIRLFRILD